MGRFVEAADRHQASFLPACLEDYVDADNPVRIIDAFVDELGLAELGFARVQPAATGRLGMRRARCSSSTFMATFISWHQAGSSSARQAATSS
jgi:hypothetical protein